MVVGRLTSKEIDAFFKEPWEPKPQSSMLRHLWQSSMERKNAETTKLHLVRSRRVAGGNVNESLYPPRLCQPRHTHDLASISLVVSGNYLETYGRKTHSREPSTAVFHPPGESHAVEFEDDVRIVSVQFDLQRLAQIREHSPVMDASTSRRSVAIDLLGKRLYREFRQPDAPSALATEGLVLELLAEASRCRTETAEKSFPRWLGVAKDFLHARFAESFTHDELARVCEVHPVHLSRVFREKFGCTIGEYVRRLRVEFAARQILLTDLPCGEIAHAAGFADQSHFNRTFKSLYGLTPNQYRQLSRRS